MTDAPVGQPNYPGNSNKDKERLKAVTPIVKKDKPQLEKVITGEIVERKKPLGRRIVESFTGDDSKSVGHFVLFDVILPTTKQLISDVVSQGIERLLFGDNSRSVQRGGYRTVSNYSPNRPVHRPNEPARAISQQARKTHDFNEIVIESRPEAQKVLDDLTASLEQFNVVTVSDLYDLVGITGSFQDDKWGWYDLRAARIVRVREGYLLDLPKPEAVE